MFLNKFNVKRKELSSLLYSPTSWFSDSQLMNEIKYIDDTSIVLPLSEYIRFSSDKNFKEMITSLSEMENNKIKIYVPLVGLWERFKCLFWDKFYRKDNWAPIWKLKTEPKKN